MALNKKEKEERLKFVRFWANYIKSHPNRVWSKQQNVLINSVMKSVDKDPKRYMKLKETLARIRSTS
jgi:hypothetical protein